MQDTPKLDEHCVEIITVVKNGNKLPESFNIYIYMLGTKQVLELTWGRIYGVHPLFAEAEIAGNLGVRQVQYTDQWSRIVEKTQYEKN